MPEQAGSQSKGSTMTSTRTASRATRAADQMTVPATDADKTSALLAAGFTDDQAAAMVKSITPRAPRMNVKRTVGNDLVSVAADLAAGWNPDERSGIARDVAADLIAKWISYIPCSEWPADILGERPVRKNGKSGEADDEAESESEK